MKISELIAGLQNAHAEFGDVEVRLQGPIEEVAHEHFFIVAEGYAPEDGGTAVNLRVWHS